jgi:hypothetical protein
MRCIGPSRCKRMRKGTSVDVVGAAVATALGWLGGSGELAWLRSGGDGGASSGDALTCRSFPTKRFATMRTTVLLALVWTMLAACGGKTDGPDAPSDAVKAPPAASNAGKAPPVASNAGNTIAFTPSEILVEHSPRACGAPFMDGDSYSMELLGSMAQYPYSSLGIGFATPVPVGRAVALGLNSFIPPGTGEIAGQSAEGPMSFQYDVGAVPTDIDGGPLDSVDVTIEAMPAKDATR